MNLVVIPSDPLKSLLDAGYSKAFLRDYFNPMHFFEKTYLLSPFEPSVRREMGLIVIPTIASQLRKRIKELKIDAVRAYGGYWACDMACKNKVSGVPVIISVHDTNPGILHDSIKNADVIFCVSHVVRDLVLTIFSDPSRVWILPNRVNFQVMNPHKTEGLKELNEKYPFRYKILFVGRKSQQKNLDTTIKALKILGKEYCLLAIGKGDSQEYSEIARNEGVQDQMYFIESIPNEQLSSYYSWADCMCTPSRWEGFGIVFIEALACEAIVVTSDIAPMNEFIEHMKNGLLVKEYENPQALAQMISLACTNQEIRKQLKINARKSVEKFEKSRIDALEASYYQKISQMKYAGKFQIPTQKKLKSFFISIIEKNRDMIDHILKFPFIQKRLPGFPGKKVMKGLWNRFKQILRLS